MERFKVKSSQLSNLCQRVWSAGAISLGSEPRRNNSKAGVTQKFREMVGIAFVVRKEDN